MQFVNILVSVLNLVLGFLLAPSTLLVLFLGGNLAAFAFMFKFTWARTLFFELVDILKNAWGDLKVDPLAFALLAVIYSVAPQLFVWAAIAYIVATKIGIHIHPPSLSTILGSSVAAAFVPQPAVTEKAAPVPAAAPSAPAAAAAPSATPGPQVDASGTAGKPS